MNKLRVWWLPQVCAKEIFYVPVESPEEGKKMLDVLAAYDAFQLQKNIKPDHCNTGGLETFDEEKQEWCNWQIESDSYYYDDIRKYCESDDCAARKELSDFSYTLFSQIDWSRC